MFISADYYQELYLDDKDEAAVLAEVKKIRDAMGDLKRKMETPSYSFEVHPYPSEVATVSTYRDYLARALMKLGELRGDDSALTDEERRDAWFQKKIPDISALTLTMGRYLQFKHELSFGEGVAHLKTFHLDEEPTVSAADPDEITASLYSLHLGEWRDNYSPMQYGFTVDEATEWQLRVDYRDGTAPHFVDGRGIFPYNFNQLLSLLGAD